MGEATIISVLAASFLVALSGALMPGPLLALTIGETVRYGFRAGPLIVLGHAILELALVIALVFGLSRIIGNMLVVSIIGIVGGLALVYMGFSSVRQGWRNVEMLASAAKTASRKLVVSGIVVSASNPYWALWWATIGMTYLLWSLNLGVGGVAAFFGGHISADIVWYMFIALVIVKGKQYISNKAYRWFLIVCGVALVGLGIYFIFSGIRYLVG
ncbi:MAG: LysE family transporter [Dehalococcoidales bacterium]|nr:LysE family transporter [Dehalococcoidales bacterium]